jgi:hypothetical protein
VAAAALAARHRNSRSFWYSILLGIASAAVAVAAGCQLGEWPVGLCEELKANNCAEEVEWLHTLETPPCGNNCTARQQRSSVLAS